MAGYLSPGVYVEEYESGTKPMEGVGTSTAGFIGAAERGPVEGAPGLVTNFAEFTRIYGGYLSADEYGDYRFLAYAVEHFFINGGSRAFIARVAPKDAVCAKGMLPDEAAQVLVMTARNPGTWGNRLKVVISPSSKAKTQIMEVMGTPADKCYAVKNGAGFCAGDVVEFSDGEQLVYNRIIKRQDNLITFEQEFGMDVTDRQLLPSKVIRTCEFNMEVRFEDMVENYDYLSFNSSIDEFVERKAAKSRLITVALRSQNANGGSFSGTALDSGSRSWTAAGGEEKRAYIPAFIQPAESGKAAISVDFAGGSNGSAHGMAAVDFIGVDSGSGQRTGIQAFLDNDVVSIMAVPGVTDPDVQLSLAAHCEKLNSRFAVLDMPRAAGTVQEILKHRHILDTTYAAFYHPWLKVFDPLDKQNICIPPSGSIAGIYARSDNTRGVHKAPANEVVQACVGLDMQFNTGQQDLLNPEGVNLIRAFPGRGILVWGARTASSDSRWKYVNVRRLFIFMEESIKANTNWVVFEPNDEMLWGRVRRTIEVFLDGLWRGGALAGSVPEEAFFVQVGRDTMSQDDIDNGRLICVIGAAPVRPAEFVIFRIFQNTGMPSDI